MPPHWMRRFAIGWHAAALGAGMLGWAAPAAAARSDWRELSAGHFQLFSTLSDRGTRDVARQLQGFEQTVEALLLTGDRLPDTPTQLFLLNEADFKKYAAPRPNLGGFFQELPYVNLMVVNSESAFEFVRVSIFHEFVHYIQRNTGTQQYPPWYTEGYAELFSGFQIKKDQLSLGKLPEGVRIDPSQWIPVERLLAVKQTDPEYQAERLMPQFYGESWALVHMLLFDDKALRGPTRDYLDSLGIGIPEAEAFEKSFPFGKAELDKRLRLFVARERIVVRTYTLDKELKIEQAPVKRLSEGEADMAFIRLLWELRKPPDSFAAIVAEASSKLPDDPQLRALLARMAAHSEHPLPIDDLAVTLARGGTDHPQERIDIAEALLRSSLEANTNQQAIAVLADLVRGDTAPIEAVALWTEAAERTQVEADLRIAVLDPVRTRAPHDTRVLQALARAYVAKGDKPKAREMFDQIILVSPYLEERRWAQKQVDSPALHDPPKPAGR